MAKKSAPQKAAKKTAKKAVAKKPANLLRGRDMATLQTTHGHPWNPNAEIIGVRLGHKLGLKRVAVNFARIPVGKESFVPHAHHREEEWVYILYGQGSALIDGKEYDVVAGDFMAFPAPQVVHQLKNTGFEDLVYLMGGQVLDADIVDFPTLKKRMVWDGGDVRAYDADAGVNPFAAAVKKKRK